MNEPASINKSTSGTSRTRKLVSYLLLAVALIVLGIELRAGIGQANSAKALGRVSTEGVFDNLPLVEARDLLSLSPQATVIRDNENEKVTQYRWVSLLRPVINQPQPELFLVSSTTDPEFAIAFYTEPQDAASGFYGNPVPVEESATYTPMDENPLNLPDAPETSESQTPATGDSTNRDTNP